MRKAKVKRESRIAHCPECGGNTKQVTRWILREEGGKSDLTWYCTSCFTPFEILVRSGPSLKEFGPGTVARTNRSNKRFVLDTYVKVELVQETDSGKVYRVTHLVMGGGEFDSPWIYESDQEEK